MIRDAVDKTGSMKDIVARGLRRDPGPSGNRTLRGHECHDAEIDTGAQSGQALDSSRSRGYGRYEI
jgi:hypothetical protein